MDSSTAKKSTSLETLIIQNITNTSELKSKLNEIITIGKDYKYDVSTCLMSLLSNGDQEIVLLSIKSISELAKCEDKRQTYAHKDVILPILNLLHKQIESDDIELMNQCCRALGNLCCDCDTARKIILENYGVQILLDLLNKTIQNYAMKFDEVKLLTAKTLLNFAIGAGEFTEAIIQGGVIELLCKILKVELIKSYMNDDMVSTALIILSVIIENNPEFLFDDKVNTLVLDILRETANIDVSELCLEHLHAQAEHDSVKTLLTKEGGVQLVCSRLEQLRQRNEAGGLNADDAEVQAVLKQACDLIIIVLTGDEAMHLLYKNGLGEVYQTMVKWLDWSDHQLLITAVLAIGNFARQDDYCMQMMEDKIFDKLLDLFKIYHRFSIRIQKEQDQKHPIEIGTVTKIEHAVLSALRNLMVPVENKRIVAAQGKAAPILLKALPETEDPHVAYKLLATIRMLLDGQESVARQLVENSKVLGAAARWGGGGGPAGAGGEAPRLVAWAAREVRSGAALRRLVQVEGCISSLVNMLVASHSVMQNESILALTLLAIELLNNEGSADPEYDDLKNSLISQLIKSEIGQHVSVLIETNCAKMPVEVAENLLAFLDITSKKNEIVLNYKESKVQESLQKIADARKDFSDDMKRCVAGVISAISNNNQNQSEQVA